MKRLRLDSNILLIVGFCLFALMPLTAPGYFTFGHDARHSVYFLQMFDESIRDGAWYPRWASDMVFGYGYPLWLILAPIPFFLGEAFHLLGWDFVSAVKIVDGLAFLGSALSMYLFTSRVLNRNAALVAAVVYAYVPYHLVDLYVRSAQAELVSFVFPPLVLWAFNRLESSQDPWGDGRPYILVAAFSCAGLVLTHIQSAVLFTPLIGLYFLALLAQARRRNVSIRYAISAGSALALALGLAAIFIFPILAEQKFLTTEPLIGGFFNYRKHFVSPSQLLSPFWGYGVAGENGNDYFSLQLGLIPLFLAAVSIFGWARLDGQTRWHVALFSLITLGLVLAMLSFSAGMWDLIAGVVAYFQFPWRLLILTAFTLAFLSGAAVSTLADHLGNGAIAICLLVVVANYPYTEPQHTDADFNNRTQMEFEVKDRELLGDTIWMTGPRPQDSPLVPQYLSGEPLQKAIALDEGVSVRMVRHGGQSDTVLVESALPARILFYTRYFPGWAANIDGRSVPLEPYGEQGLIAVNTPSGSHTVEIRYVGTATQMIGAIVSLATTLGAILWFAKARMRA